MAGCRVGWFRASSGGNMQYPCLLNASSRGASGASAMSFRRLFGLTESSTDNVELRKELVSTWDDRPGQVSGDAPTMTAAQLRTRS